MANETRKTDEERERDATRNMPLKERREAQARERRLHPPDIEYVSPFNDPEGLLTPPLADPIANSSGLVIPPAVLDESLLPPEEPVLPPGEPLPELATLTGKQQELVEVLTGKRLQRDEAHVTPTPEEVRARREGLPGSAPRPGRPVINPRPTPHATPPA